jgi:hypothetical protein
MRWLLRALPLLVLLGWVESTPGCSNGDDTGAGGIADASQPSATKFEAGSNCASSGDCELGLVCLFPVSTCGAYAICVPPPGPDGGGCATPQYACSCIDEVIEVCGGYAANPVDTASTCDGGIVLVDSGAGDGGASESGADATAPVAEAGADSAASVDATTDAPSGVDASDAAGE